MMTTTTDYQHLTWFDWIRRLFSYDIMSLVMPNHVIVPAVRVGNLVS